MEVWNQNAIVSFAWRPPAPPHWVPHDARFHETFSASRSSPHCTVSGSSAWRLATGGKGEYAAAALAHNYYDVHAEVLLEVLSFGAVPRHRCAVAGGGGMWAFAWVGCVGRWGVCGVQMEEGEWEGSALRASVLCRHA